MKRLVSISLIAIFIFLTALAAAVTAIVVFRNLETRIKNPDFKARVESEVSKLIGCQVQIGSMDSHIGLHPWLSVDDVKLIAPNNNFHVNAGFVRVDLNLWPLLKKEIIFSRINVQRSQLISQAPPLRIEANAVAKYSNLNKCYEVKSDGKLISSNIQGRFKLNGELSTDQKWKAQVFLNNLVMGISTSTLPVQIQAVASSSGPFKISSHWKSNLSDFTAHVEAPHWQDLNLTGQLNSSELNMLELKEVFESFRSTSAAANVNSVGRSTWTARVNWDLKNIAFNQEILPRVQGQVTLGPSGGQVPYLWADVLGGSVTASGSWKINKSKRIPMLVRIQAKGEKLRVEKVLALTISTVPWSGGFNFDLNLVDFPIKEHQLVDAGGILESLSQARALKLAIGGDASFREKSPIQDIVGTVELDPTGQIYNAGLQLKWEEGGFKALASLPHITREKVVGPLDISLSVNNLNLKFLPQLAQKLEFSKANFSADIKWHTNQIGPGVFQILSPDVEWTLDGHFRELIWRQIPLDKVAGNVSWHESRLQMENIRGSVSSGTFMINGILSKFQSDGFHRFESYATMTNIEVSPFMYAISTYPILMHGRFSSTVNLSGDIRPFNPERLAGEVTLDGRSGHLRMGSFILELLTRLNLKSIFETVTGKRQQGYPFDVIAATGAVGGGRVTFENPAVIKNKSMEIAFTGWGAIDAQAGEGVVVVNSLVGTRNLLSAVPGVSSLVMGPDGEFLPLIVDVTFKKGQLDTKFRSIKTLTDLPLRIIGNVIRLPGTILGGGKKSATKDKN